MPQSQFHQTQEFDLETLFLCHFCQEDRRFNCACLASVSFNSYFTFVTWILPFQNTFQDLVIMKKKTSLGIFSSALIKSCSDWSHHTNNEHNFNLSKELLNSDHRQQSIWNLKRGSAFKNNHNCTYSSNLTRQAVKLLHLPGICLTYQSLQKNREFQEYYFTYSLHRHHTSKNLHKLSLDWALNIFTYQ